MSKMPIARLDLQFLQVAKLGFAVHDRYHRPLLVRIALLEFLGEPVEDHILGVDFLAVNFPSQNGTQSLVLRLIESSKSKATSPIGAAISRVR